MSTGLGFVSQPNPVYGLARVSNRRTGGTSYTYDDSAGSGVCIYSLDTGVDDNHPDFKAVQSKSSRGFRALTVMTTAVCTDFSLFGKLPTNLGLRRNPHCWHCCLENVRRCQKSYGLWLQSSELAERWPRLRHHCRNR